MTPGRRAQRRADTRRRIVEATVELHTTVGPVGTTISGIAQRAGVQRHTVYAHFPNEDELFRACTDLWRSRHPFPDAGRWTAIGDPRERLVVALDEVYGFYDRSGADLVAVFEGAERMPAMAESLAERAAATAAMARVVARGRDARGRRRVRLLAAIEHALQLDTWRSLVHAGGLTSAEVVPLLLAFVEAACEPAAQGRPASAPPGCVLQSAKGEPRAAAR